MFTRLGRLRNDDSVAQIAGKAVADGKEGGKGREERWGKNGEDNRQQGGEEDVKS